MTTFIFFHGDVNYDYQDIKPTSLNSHIIIKKNKKKNQMVLINFQISNAINLKLIQNLIVQDPKSFRHYFKILNSIPYFQHRIPWQSKF